MQQVVHDRLDRTEELSQAARGYLAELAGRDGARMPATLGEIWRSEWSRSGLDTIGGQARLLADSYDELTAAIADAAGTSFGEFARANGVNFDGTVEGRIAATQSLIDALPENARGKAQALRDVRARTAEKAQKRERDAADIGEVTYGLSGVATSFLAGMARQMVDPTIIAANLATAPVGGPFKGPIFGVIARQGAAGAAGQALVEPAIQQGRAELGLDHGFLRGTGNVLEAGVGSAALTVLLRGGAAALRLTRRTAAGESAPSPATNPPGLPENRALESPPGAAPALSEVQARQSLEIEDFEAAAALAERNALTEPTSPRAGERLAGVSDAMEQARPIFTDPSRTALHSPSQTGVDALMDGSGMQSLIRPGGGRLEVTPVVVELGDLIASHNLEGRPNPAYPPELQPRDRAAPASRTWVAEKAAALEPELLGHAPTAATGAPVVGPDGIVESGNGRVLLLAQAYERHPERIAAYREFLEAEGFEVAGFREPVLVRVREGELTLAERAALAREANVSPTAGMSARERAFSDARSLDENLLAAYRPGDVQSAGNAGFVRSFADRVVAPEERPQFVGADDRISFEGARRVEAALVAKAWGQEDIVAALYESPDPTSKAILGAFADTAPQVARLRAAIAEGRVGGEADPTPALVEAFRLIERARATRAKVADMVDQVDIERARATRAKVADMVDQVDIERGAVPAAVREATRLYFRDDALRQAAGRDAVAERIDKAVSRALDQQNAVGDLFGDKFDAARSLRGAQLAGRALDEQPIAGDSRADLLAMIEAKALPDDIAAHPLVQAAIAEERARPRTDTLPGYGTPAFQAAREFNFDGEKVTGYPAAIARLTAEAQAFAGGAAANERRAIVVLGPPAAGKSTFADAIARDYRAALVDPDEAKKVIPEYAGGVGAGAVHEESTVLADGVLKRLIGQGSNIVLPKVGANPEKMQNMVKALAELGYSVSAVHVTVQPDEAYRRMVRRFLVTGRIVASDYFADVGLKPRDTYTILKKEGLLTDAAEIDANGRIGAHKVIDGDGELARRLDPERSRGELGRQDPQDAERGQGPPQRQQAEIGNAALRQDADRVLAEVGGDLDITLINPDGSTRTVSARAALAEVDDDARAAAELTACIGEEFAA